MLFSSSVLSSDTSNVFLSSLFFNNNLCYILLFKYLFVFSAESKGLTQDYVKQFYVNIFKKYQFVDDFWMTKCVETCCSLLKIICYHFSYETAKANFFKRDFYIDL